LELDSHSHTLFWIVLSVILVFFFLLLLLLFLFDQYHSYGKGPYYAEFRLQFPERSGTDSFVVEFPSRKELPHSVFTFMGLVESELYDGTSILSKRDGAMRIGGNPQHEARLSQRYKALGYGESALSFVESSPSSLSSFPCRRHSVGFLGRGPALEIHVSDRHVNDQDRTCLGRVVQGIHVLERVEASMEKGEVVDIVQVRVQGRHNMPVQVQQVEVQDASRREL
jgi:cyclophilin family peptidyl-prolyl cis-trans isomerase